LVRPQSVVRAADIFKRAGPSAARIADAPVLNIPCGHSVFFERIAEVACIGKIVPGPPKAAVNEEHNGMRAFPRGHTDIDELIWVLAVRQSQIGVRRFLIQCIFARHEEQYRTTLMPRLHQRGATQGSSRRCLPELNSKELPCYLGELPEACADDPELCAGEGEDEPDDEDPECEAPEDEAPEYEAPPPPDECDVAPDEPEYDEPEYDDPECDDPECDDEPLSAVRAPELDPLPLPEPPLSRTWFGGEDGPAPPEFFAVEVSVPGFWETTCLLP